MPKLLAKAFPPVRHRNLMLSCSAISTDISYYTLTRANMSAPAKQFISSIYQLFVSIVWILDSIAS